MGDELGAECRTTNPDDQQMLKESGSFGTNAACVDIVRKMLDGRNGVFNSLPDGGLWRTGRVPQPIMTHHPVLIRVCDCA